MATAKKQTDLYPNIIVEKVTTSAADTLTFSEIRVGLNIFDKVGLKIQRIEYEFGSDGLTAINAAGDAIQAALVGNNNLANINPDQQEVIDEMTLYTMGFLANGAADIHKNPIIHDFSTLDGGGILVNPKPLYAAVGSTALGAVATVTFRFYFTIVQLSDADYLELLQNRNAFG